MKFLLLNIAPGFNIIQRKKIVWTDSAFYPPLGLLYIGRSLEDDGHHVEIIDFLGEKHPKERLAKYLPSSDVVGFTLYTPPYKEAVHIVETVKETDPDIPIIIGGPHCTFHPHKALLDVPNADISVEGEGEQTINNVAKALQGTKKFSEIPGISYRRNQVIKTGKRAKVIDNLDSISFPARHLTDKYDYGKVNNVYFYKPRFTSMITSRGCPFRCRFCTRHVSSMKRYRKRSVENVVEEIQEINDKCSSVMIVDDTFLADEKRVHKIMDEIIEAGVDLEFYIQGARVDTAERSLYKKMKKAGVKHLYFGIESGNQDVLDFYNKKITLDQIRKAVALSKEMNFFTRGTFILGAPIETRSHIEQTIQFASSLPLDIALFRPLFYQHGSDLWNEAVKNGKINEDECYDAPADSRLGLGEFTYEELVDYCLKAYKKFHLRPSYLVRQIIQSIIYRDFSILKVGLNYI